MGPLKCNQEVHALERQLNRKFIKYSFIYIALLETQDYKRFDGKSNAILQTIKQSYHLIHSSHKWMLVFNFI